MYITAFSQLSTRGQNTLAAKCVRLALNMRSVEHALNNTFHRRALRVQAVWLLQKKPPSESQLLHHTYIFSSSSLGFGS